MRFFLVFLFFSSLHASQEEEAERLSSEIFAYVSAGQKEEAIAALQKFDELSDYALVWEAVDDHYLLKNIPDSECAKGILAHFFTKKQMGITPISENEWEITPKAWRGEGFRDWYTPGRSTFLGVEGLYYCESWCDENAFAALRWCEIAFFNRPCRYRCTQAVAFINRMCHSCCCQGGCIDCCSEPFGRIVEFMDPPCW